MHGELQAVAGADLNRLRLFGSDARDVNVVERPSHHGLVGDGAVLVPGQVEAIAFDQLLPEDAIAKIDGIAGNDIETLQPRTRQAHGLYTIYAPVQPVAIMAEADVLLDNNNGASSTGLVGTGVVDWEPTQGLHLQGIGQYCDPNFADPASAAWTGGGGVQWFFTSRLDVRVDAFQGVLYCTPGATPSPMGLLQAHFYL